MPLAVESISASQPWLTVACPVLCTTPWIMRRNRGKLYYANGHVGGGAPTVDLDGGQETRKLGAVPNLKPGRWCRGGPGKGSQSRADFRPEWSKGDPQRVLPRSHAQPFARSLSTTLPNATYALDIRYRTLPTRNFSVMTHPNTEPQPQEFHNCCLSPE